MTMSNGTTGLPAIPFTNWGAAGRARGYAYHERVVAPKLRGMLFTEGSGVIAERVVDALESPTPFLAGRVSAVYTAAKKPLSTLFIAIPLARSMPSVVLVNARSGALREAGLSLGSRELLTLPGDFDRTYSLYCPIGGSSLALSVFTPELLQSVLNRGSDSDIEVVDNWMFVYGSAGETTSEHMLDSIENLALRVGAAIVTPAVESAAGTSAPGGPSESRGRIDGVVPAKKTSGLTLVLVSIVAVVAGVLVTVWGSGLH
jgi:hypothetical protein